MKQCQRDHIATVIDSVSQHPALTSGEDRTIRDSWLRCVQHYGMDPSRIQEAQILSGRELHRYRQALEEFRSVARYALAGLHQQIADSGYVVLLADTNGVTVDFHGEESASSQLRRAGLYSGSLWSEAIAGTCAVGTALATGAALTVHRADHFNAGHISLTCSAVPLHDSHGNVMAVLDISALGSPRSKSSQRQALTLTGLTARKIEQAWFSHVHRHDRILKLSQSAFFADLAPELLLALDGEGRVMGYSPPAQRVLLAENTASAAQKLSGLHVQQLFDVGDDATLGWLFRADGQPKTLSCLHGGRALYAVAVAPAPSRRTLPATTPTLPPALAALSGGDNALEGQLRRAARLLDSPLNLVIKGETGCGKEFFARAFHQASRRGTGPFIAVNCAAIPATLVESELFGYLPGSFSGGDSRGRRGLIQQADGGTLFLDEIGDMPLEMQTRLLRVLAEQEVLPVGATRPIAVNVRVLAASHHRLEQRVAEGHFRSDLFYRLQGASITLPPLRQRQDLDWLIDKLLAEGTRLSPVARQLLHAHDWPGNLRELNNVLAYAAAMQERGEIAPQDLPETFHASDGVETDARRDAASASLPPQALLLVNNLRAARWNHSAVARQMGISRMTLYRRMQRFGIVSPTHEEPL